MAKIKVTRESGSGLILKETWNVKFDRYFSIGITVSMEKGMKILALGGHRKGGPRIRQLCD